jgi:hypothetical protein
MAGSSDYLLRVVAPDIEAYEALLKIASRTSEGGRPRPHCLLALHSEGLVCPLSGAPSSRY